MRGAQWWEQRSDRQHNGAYALREKHRTSVRPANSDTRYCPSVERLVFRGLLFTLLYSLNLAKRRNTVFVKNSLVLIYSECKQSHFSSVRRAAPLHPRLILWIAANMSDRAARRRGTKRKTPDNAQAAADKAKAEAEVAAQAAVSGEQSSALVGAVGAAASEQAAFYNDRIAVLQKEESTIRKGACRAPSRLQPCRAATAARGHACGSAPALTHALGWPCFGTRRDAP